MKKKIFFGTVLALIISYCYAQNIKIAKISTTSTLTSPTNLYKAENLIDESDASWVEGAKDFGKDVTITIEFASRITLKEFYIKNGYGDYKHYYANNRVKTLYCGFQYRGGASIVLEDKPGYQKVTFDIPVQTNKLELKIGDVYKGDTFDDTAIAEISFKDWRDLNHDKINASIFSNRIDDIYGVYKKADESIGAKQKTSFFSYPRKDTRHTEDWFFTLLSRTCIPLANGDVYYITALDSEAFGQNKTSAYPDTYVLFVKLENGKFIGAQTLFPSLGNNSDVEYLNAITHRLDVKQKNLIEKYVRMIAAVLEAKKTNMPFFCDLFDIEVTEIDNTFGLYLKDYTDLPSELRNLFPGYTYKYMYNAPYTRITKVFLP
ncbi:hypothetical protein H0R92_06545 [Treponema sp. OMZ 840]|uniref:NADase-type glycan-binding domain-containing protein n=1 Tax=Treponema sp. OMZ 840 TaxID=244313 RepID=UPI003D8D32D9